VDERKNGGVTYKLIEGTVGTEYLLEFRETFKEIVLDKSEKLDRWNPSKNTVQQDGLQAANEARKIWWDKVVILLSFISAVASIGISDVPSILSLVGFFLAAVLYFRRVAVEVLIYPNPYNFHLPDDVKFAYAWNTAMKGWTSLAIFLIALIARLYPPGYVAGMWFIDQIVEEHDAVEIT
jgi:hypothetical protein